MNFLDLPLEIRSWYLFSFLTYSSLRPFLQINREYRSIGKSSKFWRYLLRRDLDLDYVGPFGAEIYAKLHLAHVNRFFLGVDYIIKSIHLHEPLLHQIRSYFPLFKIMNILGLVFFQFRINNILRLFFGKYRSHYIFQIYPRKDLVDRNFMIKIRLTTTDSIPRLLESLMKYLSLDLHGGFHLPIVDRYGWYFSSRIWGLRPSILSKPLVPLIEELALVKIKYRDPELKKRQKNKDRVKEKLRSLYLCNRENSIFIIVCSSKKILPISHLGLMSFFY